MHRNRHVAALFVASTFALTGCGDDGSAAPGDGEISGRVTIFAAASLTETFTALGAQFEAAHPGVDVVFSFGASSELAEQIRQGAPADVFASAAPKNMQQVVDSGDITGSPVTFVRNSLEIAVPAGNPGAITGLSDFGREEPVIALCAEQVPCGAAATKVFESARITPKPDTREPDVKAVLSKVTLGEVDAALVYRTDVRAAGDKVDGIEFAESASAVNEYPIAPVAHAPNAPAAAAFVDFIGSDAARPVFADAGFETP
ncbi:molybdate ABC transporter substrate-binding protein [Nocardia cyriacigeorgica]|uniref:molybdate ABC transporter substrate-binding protein n=1 Tax=Nocardia cyriacigeorgica TaxID=135487 RepID=UPI0018932A9E|nr:molybdate ABC transporter substrate-binding protein [Nocardia cyriacigeorgica]MBF6455620.1 molybdate ABC transporter substrate-binding protein [Nocardia cyriacigeorgica]MBF6477512.1 molybdate ABC transporter substrate-binding protein [Nocardia cyriacigeorgica]MBF6553638.1 molybdate ABC transporter substrate-binding protein [Nocardia cyriacigeorgica]